MRYEREAMFIGRERGKLFRVSCSDLTLDPSGNESGVAQRCTETDIRQLFVNLTLARCLPPAPSQNENPIHLVSKVFCSHVYLFP